MRTYIPYLILLAMAVLASTYASGQELTTTEYMLINGLHALEQVPYVGSAAAWGVKLVTSIIMLMTALATVVRPVRAAWCFFAQRYPNSRILAAGCPHLSRLYCVFGFFSAYNVSPSDIKRCDRPNCQGGSCGPSQR